MKLRKRNRKRRRTISIPSYLNTWSLKCVDHRGRTSLMIAASKADYGMMENLINIGVPINARDNDGNNALYWLSKFEDKIIKGIEIYFNYPTNHLKCYNLLVRNGIDLENINYNGETVYDSFEKNPQCKEILNYYYRSNSPPPSNWFYIAINFLFYLYLFLVGFILLRLVVIKYDINLHLEKLNYTLLPQTLFGIIKDFQLYIEYDEFLFKSYP